jgi:hypothetical protein
MTTAAEKELHAFGAGGITRSVHLFLTYIHVDNDSVFLLTDYRHSVTEVVLFSFWNSFPSTAFRKQLQWETETTTKKKIILCL